MQKIYEKPIINIFFSVYLLINLHLQHSINYSFLHHDFPHYIMLLNVLCKSSLANGMVVKINFLCHVEFLFLWFFIYLFLIVMISTTEFISNLGTTRLRHFRQVRCEICRFFASFVFNK